MRSAKISTTILLIAAILIIVNILSENYYIRLDFTEDKEYTLSRATKDILKNLEEPVTINAYFSKNLPPDIGKVSGDLKDMLIEYGNRSDGMVVYKFMNPNENEKLEGEALQNGIQPLMINVREKDQVKQQKAYMGAVVSMGEEKETIPFFQPGSAMEYALSTAIKKLSVTEKPKIALIQGHGEPQLSELLQVYNDLSILYQVQPFMLTDTTLNLADFKTIAIVRPTDTISPVQLSILDDYLTGGGNIFLALNRVSGDFSNAMGSAISVGLEDWLKRKGLTISPDFIVDASCGAVTLQQQYGNMTMSTQMSFPYLPVIHKFAEHPVTKGLESVSLQFASPITYSGDSTIKYAPMAFSSEKSGTLNTPLYFEVQKQWTENDFTMSDIVIAASLEGKLAGDANSKMIIISDGDFAVGNPQGGNTLPEDNINLMINSIDWLSDDTGLIDLRTKGITSRPIRKLEDSTKALIKWSNFLVPIILIIIYGVVRMQFNRNKRIRRMEVNYE